MRRSLRPLAAAALALTTAACTARMHTPAVEIRLATSARALGPGDTLRLATTLANPTADTLALVFATECRVIFHVSAPDHRVVHPVPDPPACPLRAQTLRIAPGDSRTFEDRWTVPAGAAPGAYLAYAILEEHHLERRGTREFKAGHRSNEITVRVDERR